MNAAKRAAVDDEIDEALEMTDLSAGLELAAARSTFQAAYLRARALEGWPSNTFHFKHGEFIRRCAGERPQQQLAIMIEGRRYWERMLDEKNWPTSRYAEQQALAATQAANAAQALRASGFAFSPFAFITSLRNRGMTISADAEGRISISPAMANETDRALCRTHRAAIVALLQTTEAL